MSVTVNFQVRDDNTAIFTSPDNARCAVLVRRDHPADRPASYLLGLWHAPRHPGPRIGGELSPYFCERRAVAWVRAGGEEGE